MSDGRSVNAVDVRLGQRVRARRLEIDMSQERLADLLGVTFQQVQKYEKGVNRISASRLFAISSALDMPISRFFEGLAKAQTKAARDDRDLVEQTMATNDGRTLMTLFASVKSARVRKRVIELARSLIEDEA